MWLTLRIFAGGGTFNNRVMLIPCAVVAIVSVVPVVPSFLVAVPHALSIWWLSTYRDPNDTDEIEGSVGSAAGLLDALLFFGFHFYVCVSPPSFVNSGSVQLCSIMFHAVLLHFVCIDFITFCKRVIVDIARCCTHSRSLATANATHVVHNSDECNPFMCTFGLHVMFTLTFSFTKNAHEHHQVLGGDAKNLRKHALRDPLLSRVDERGWGHHVHRSKWRGCRTSHSLGVPVHNATRSDAPRVQPPLIRQRCDHTFCLHFHSPPLLGIASNAWL
jgi:hypothetical protein